MELVRADRLAARLGVKELYVKDDGVNHPTLSYKDRVVSVAATRAVELGFTVFACASTGNLAGSVAAHAIGEHQQADVGVYADRVFVVLAHEPYVGAAYDLHHDGTLFGASGNHGHALALAPVQQPRGGVASDVVRAVPHTIANTGNTNFYLGGTSILIVVSVTMDTVAQIQSHLLAHQYEGLIKKSKLRGRGR